MSKSFDKQALSLHLQVKQYLAWQRSPDEALQQGIEDVLHSASDTAKADIFAKICEAEDFEVETIVKVLSEAL